MKITYDPEADALYIALRDVAASDSADIEDGVSADLDSEGHIVGVEILDASKRLTPEELANVHYENLLLISSAAAEAT
jgi:uncharacterized protein YuzE